VTHPASSAARQTRRLLISLALMLAGAAQATGVFECKVVDGALKSPGKMKVERVDQQDTRILGEVFTVRQARAEVRGSLIYRTEQRKVEVLRRSDDQYSLLIRDAGVAGDDDISIITLDRVAGRWSFKHYSSWLGLLTSGSCREL
jgi:hypothetical protein